VKNTLPVQRGEASLARITGFLAPLIAVLAAFIVGAILILWVGKDPIVAYTALFSGALGDVFGIQVQFGESILKMTPLLFIGLGVAFALHCRAWNIGAEGQLYLGALGATLVALHWPNANPWLIIPATIAASFLFGAGWAAIPAFFKARFHVDEIISTFLMNFVGLFFVSYLAHGPMRDPEGFMPQTRMISENAELPVLVEGTRIHLGIGLAIICAVILYVIIKHTTWGYELQAVGANREAARYGGISVGRNIFLALVVSGGLAGLAGMGEVQGNMGRLTDTISPGYGFTGIVVAILGRLNPAGIIVSSFFFAILLVGGDAMQGAAKISSAMIEVLQGMIVLFVIGSEILMNEAFRREIIGRFKRQAKRIPA
jgi:simple sugar transport system permease protein